MSKKNYDIGLGRDYFYLFVKGKKKPIARILSAETEGVRDVEKWAKKEYEKYRKKMKKVI